MVLRIKKRQKELRVVFKEDKMPIINMNKNEFQRIIKDSHNLNYHELTEIIRILGHQLENKYQNDMIEIRKQI